jgi:hypothetical protein
MADGTTPGAPPGAPGDLATTIGIVGALTHLVERMTGAGHPAPARMHHEPKQQRRQSGPARDHKGRFKRRQ